MFQFMCFYAPCVISFRSLHIHRSVFSAFLYLLLWIILASNSNALYGTNSARCLAEFKSNLIVILSKHDWRGFNGAVMEINGLKSEVQYVFQSTVSLTMPQPLQCLLKRASNSIHWRDAIKILHLNCYSVSFGCCLP